MKNLYIIGGTMGVGKTTVCQSLKTLLPNCVFLDGDWCWDAHPFVVTDETKAMVQNNICYLLNNFLHCSAYENVVFCWVMHEQQIIDDLLSCIDTSGCSAKTISLVCGEKQLRERLESDIKKGLRTPDVIERSAARLGLYEKLNTLKIETTDKTPLEIAREITAIK